VLRLLEHPSEAALLAERGRAGVLRERTLAQWVGRIAKACDL
jgi:hypothetical protein